MATLNLTSQWSASYAQVWSSYKDKVMFSYTNNTSNRYNIKSITFPMGTGKNRFNYSGGADVTGDGAAITVYFTAKIGSATIQSDKITVSHVVTSTYTASGYYANRADMKEHTITFSKDVVVEPGQTVQYIATFNELNQQSSVFVWDRDNADSSAEIYVDEYTVAYDANGGTGAPSSQTKVAGTALIISSTTPTRSGYDFVNWNSKSDGSGTNYSPGSSYTQDSDITLYAQWKLKTYLISYNANGGSEAPSSQTKTHGVDIVLSSNEPSLAGHTFKGWSITEGSDTVSYQPGSTLTVDADITLYAVWEIITYTISYSANGGTGAPSSQTKEYDKTLTLSSTKPTKSYTITYDANSGSVSSDTKTVSCTFNGWNTSSGGDGTSYASSASYTANASATLYAQWTDPTAGTLVTPTRTGYTFNGWYTAASGGTEVTSTSIISANTIIYAQWTTDTYEITYNANGGTGAPSGQTKIYGSPLTLSSAKPTKSYTIAYNANGGSVSPASKSVSCTFNNWNTKSDGTGTKYASGASYTADASVTLYAQWTNPAAGDLIEPSRNNCIFDGWYTSASGGTQVTSSTIITEDITIYARWKYIISYDMNYEISDSGDDGIEDNEGPSEDIETIEDTIKSHGVSVSLSDITPARVGYTFSGWGVTKNATSASYNPGDNYTEDSPITLYAIWDLGTFTVTFVNGFGVTLKTQIVSLGQSATPPADPVILGRKFMGWLGDYTNVNSDRTIRALWDYSPLWIYTPTGWIRFYY